MKWLKDNGLQLLVIFASVIFGYANFTFDIEKNANATINLKNRVDFIESNVDQRMKSYEEKQDKIIRLLERIDERTKKL